jgi:hypothetical protein
MTTTARTRPRVDVPVLCTRNLTGTRDADRGADSDDTRRTQGGRVVRHLGARRRRQAVALDVGGFRALLAATTGGVAVADVLLPGVRVDYPGGAVAFALVATALALLLQPSWSRAASGWAPFVRRVAERPEAPDIYANSPLDPGTEEVAAFEPLVGCHGGLGGWQDRAMVVVPTDLPFPAGRVRGADALHLALVAILEHLDHRKGLATGTTPPDRAEATSTTV